MYTCHEGCQPLTILGRLLWSVTSDFRSHKLLEGSDKDLQVN